MNEYIYKAYEGSPGTMRIWLGSMGWDESQGIHSTPAEGAVAAFGEFKPTTVGGMEMAFIGLALTGGITLPEGIQESNIGISVYMQGPKKPTPLEWMNRLSTERLTEIYVAAQSNPLLSFGLYRLGAAQEVDVSLAETQYMVNAMYEAEIITEDEKNTLLA